MVHEPYYSFNTYLQARFGVRVHRLSLDAGFDCPNIDGTKGDSGCIYCNNKAFSRFAKDRDVPLREQIARSMEYARRRFKAKKFIAYFQSFTNTYAKPSVLKERYDVIREFSDIVGLAVSTRPDCIDEEKLKILESYTPEYEVYVEYGLQSIHEKTLKRINRHHTFSDTKRALEMTAQHPAIKCAVHVILGLPGETRMDMAATAMAISRLPVWGIKFHVLHVLRDTRLADTHSANKVKLLDEDEYVDALIDFLERIPKKWVILRLVSDAEKNLLVAPEWVNQKQRVLKKIETQFAKRNTYQGARYEIAYNAYL